MRVSSILHVYIHMCVCVCERNILKDAILVPAIGHTGTRLGWSSRHLMMRMTHMTRSSRWCQVFEHALSVLREHLAEIAWHWIGPEKIMI